MTEKEFQKLTCGWDRCEVCSKTKPLVLAYDMNIGKTIEIMPDGWPKYVCIDCVNDPIAEYRFEEK